MLIASYRGTGVNPREKMTSNGSRARGLSGVFRSINNLRSEDWMERKEFSSGERERTPKILWSEMRGGKTQPLYELTITRHEKAPKLD